MTDQASSPPSLFDRASLDAHRKRALPNFEPVLMDIAIEGLTERVSDIARGFASIATVGDWTGRLATHLTPAAQVDDAETLALPPQTHDLILSALTLHWANDATGQLIQMRRALKPDGVMIAALFGGQTLHELRAALAHAEAELSGGLSPRVAPMGEIRDYGGLLQRAGFALPVADAETYTLSYPSLHALMRDLRAMGETNILSARAKHFAPSALFTRAEAIYREAFAGNDNRLPATFEILYLTGWAPDPSQPKPLRPGSATHALADILKDLPPQDG